MVLLYLAHMPNIGLGSQIIGKGCGWHNVPGFGLPNLNIGESAKGNRGETVKEGREQAIKESFLPTCRCSGWANKYLAR